jgi:hypothetical protein
VDDAQVESDDEVLYVGETDALDGRQQVPVFSRMVGTGEHRIDVTVWFHGDGSGALAYLKGFRFVLRSDNVVSGGSSRELRVDLVLFDRGPEMGAFQRRPALCWRQTPE